MGWGDVLRRSWDSTLRDAKHRDCYWWGVPFPHWHDRQRVFRALWIDLNYVSKELNLFGRTSSIVALHLRQRIEAIKKHCKTNPKKLMRQAACLRPDIAGKHSPAKHLRAGRIPTRICGSIMWRLRCEEATGLVFQSPLELNQRRRCVYCSLSFVLSCDLSSQEGDPLGCQETAPSARDWPWWTDLAKWRRCWWLRPKWGGIPHLPLHKSQSQGPLGGSLAPGILQVPLLMKTSTKSRPMRPGRMSRGKARLLVSLRLTRMLCPAAWCKSIWF